MTAPKRIYLVRNVESGDERLIRAANASQARNHAARDTLTVAVATQDQLVELVRQGYEVEECGAGEQPAEIDVDHGVDELGEEAESLTA